MVLTVGSETRAMYVHLSCAHGVRDKADCLRNIIQATMPSLDAVAAPPEICVVYASRSRHGSFQALQHATMPASLTVKTG